MPKCYYCGIDHPNLTKCPHCLQEYCPDHTQINQHDCPLQALPNPYESVHAPPSLSSSSTSEDLTPTPSPGNYDSTSLYTDGSYYWHRKPNQQEITDAFDPDSGVKIPGILWPKLSEVAHILIASILILSLSASGFIFQLRDASITLTMKFIIVGFLSLMYLVAFLVHEFSHRQTAIHFGLHTKFRLFTMGVIMTAICIFLPIKFALPGAVVVLGLENISRETGLIKLAGPLSNLILGGVLFIIGMIFYAISFSTTWQWLLLTAANFNFVLGAFNLLPFGILDGDNIKKWNGKIWLLMFIGMIVMFVLTLVLTNWLITPT